MGIPKFFRWISERYPCISEVVVENEIPQFDNLYLDMNGIIHTCSHPNENVPTFDFDEAEVYKSITHHIEFLFQMVKPKNLLFLAVDGVAPRAKLNQQRSRRFRAAKDSREFRKSKKKSDVQTPEEPKFDSNCITPGTEFMQRLHEALLSFITDKVENDPLWRQVDVIYSGHLTPGEGEHKIMEYIRHCRAHPDYKPNTRHCLYGMDADLILLGLTTHEPRFTLLREQVVFNNKSKIKSQNWMCRPEDVTYLLLHLSLLRDYIDCEFNCLKTTLPFPYDLEQIIDDWVFLTFLVGNDFIPHLPHLYIDSNGLPLLWAIYMETINSWEGYLTDKGILNSSRFAMFLQELAKNSRELFMKSLKKGGGRRRKPFGENLDCKKAPLGENGNDEGNIEEEATENLEELIEAEIKDCDIQGSEDVVDAASDVELEAAAPLPNSHTVGDIQRPASPAPVFFGPQQREQWEMDKYNKYRQFYYTSRPCLPWNDTTNEPETGALAQLVSDYTAGLEWILSYYSRGVPAWTNFYPNHYSPLLADLARFYLADSNLQTAGRELGPVGEPLTPLTQLLAVLPPQSCGLLPAALRPLVLSGESPIVQFYPLDFKIDRDPRVSRWEVVARLPFIDQSLLLKAVDSVLSELKPEDIQRNQRAQPLRFNHDRLSAKLGPKEESFHVPLAQMVFGLHSVLKEETSVATEILSMVDLTPGMRHITFQSQVEFAGVKVFDQVTKKQSVILTPAQYWPDTWDFDQITDSCLGRTVGVNWPSFTLARVVGLFNGLKSVRLPSSGSSTSLYGDHITISNLLTTQALQRQGIRLPTCPAPEHGPIVLCVQPLIGHKWFVDGTTTRLQPIWSPHESVSLLARALVIDSHKEEVCKELRETFPLHQEGFLVDPKYYGFRAQIIANRSPSNVRVRLIHQAEPNLQEFISKRQCWEAVYLTSTDLARELGVTGPLVDLITDHVYLHEVNKRGAKVAMGLNLKWNLSGEQVDGWSQCKTTGESSACNNLQTVSKVWLYSSRLSNVLQAYRDQFPEVWKALLEGALLDPPKQDYKENHIFEKKNAKRVQELSRFVKGQASASAAKKGWGSEAISSEGFAQLEQLLATHKSSLTESRGSLDLETEVDPKNLFIWQHNFGPIEPDPSVTWKLLDRVVKVNTTHFVPIGLRGTVTGIDVQQIEKVGDNLGNKLIRLEVLFDEVFNGGLTIRQASPREAVLPTHTLINLSHHHRLVERK